MTKKKYKTSNKAWADKKRNVINTFENFYNMDNYTEIDHYTLDLIKESAKAWYNYYHIEKEDRLYKEEDFPYNESETVAFNLEDEND